MSITKPPDTDEGDIGQRCGLFLPAMKDQMNKQKEKMMKDELYKIWVYDIPELSIQAKLQNFKAPGSNKEEEGYDR